MLYVCNMFYVAVILEYETVVRLLYFRRLRTRLNILCETRRERGGVVGGWEIISLRDEERRGRRGYGS